MIGNVTSAKAWGRVAYVCLGLGLGAVAVAFWWDIGPILLALSELSGDFTHALIYAAATVMLLGIYGFGLYGLFFWRGRNGRGGH